MASPTLAGRHVILGVTGGIAAYKSADLCSKLVQAGATVDVIMTDAATRFVAPLTFAALSGRPVRTDMWGEPGGDAIPHVRMAADADLLVIAPLSATSLARLAMGMADNLLAATALASDAPLVVAPAMESHMWEHPATQANLETLRARGAVVVGPDEGRLASGASGRGRMSEPAEIMREIQALMVEGGPLDGCYVLVTAGGTQEPIDPVRYVTNSSSGKMGVALAEAARDLGATVTLVHAPLQVPVPSGVECVAVRTALEMHDEVMARLPETDMLIGAAAVADYRPAQVSARKIKKGGDLTLLLERNPDILEEVGRRRGQTGLPRLVVGFAAETEDLLENASAKLRAKNLDMVVANNVTEAGAGFGSDDNRVTLLYPDGHSEPLPLLSKTEVAERVLVAALRMLK